MRCGARRCRADRVSLRVVVVDDSASFLATARVLLEREGLIVVGMASTVVDGRRRIDEVRPDVALVDIRISEESGFDLPGVGRG
jgi:DNA-binding NtrC family response regulator